MGEKKHDPVEVGLEPVPLELHQSRHRVAEERAGSPVDAPFGDEVDRDDGAEGAGIGPALFDQIDAPLPEQDLGIDDVDIVGDAFEEPRGEGRGDELRRPGGNLAPVGDRAGARRGVVELGEEEAEPPGEVEEALHPLERGRVDRAGVHRMADGAGGEEVDEQADPLHGHL